MIISIDFDGTCVTHDYPLIGSDIGAVPILKKLVESGHSLILFTMRSGKELTDSINWFIKNDIPLYGIQTNPTQQNWTNSPKAHADMYIDDCALGAPLKYVTKNYKNSTQNKRVIDWKKVEDYLILNNIIK